MEEFKPALPVSALDQDSKVAFYKKTYTNLAFAVLLFIVIEYVLLQIDFIVNLGMLLIQNMTLWLIVMVAFMFISNLVERAAFKSKDKNTQYLALFVYVVFEALIFVPLIHIAIMYSEAMATDVLWQAAVMTLSLFGGLTAVVFVTKKDFSFLRSIVTIGMFIMIGLFIAAWIGGLHIGLWFSVGMVILAAGAILYQTSAIVNEYEEDQYVAASLGLFASLMLMFWYVVQIFMSND